MTRILVHVEGQTEEEFVNSVLAPHLYSKGFTSVSARLIGRSRVRKNRGGTCPWEAVHTEIARHLSQDTAAFGTTLVDYYALPAEGPNGWPGRTGCEALRVADKAAHIQAALLQDFEVRHGHELARRFIPFVVMYEFEGLLFSEPSLMAQGMGQSEKAEQFKQIRDNFETPEHINDSPQTAPSKRILQLVPGYNKVLYGNIAALDVTLERIRQECPIFAAWLQRLEDIP